MVWGFEHGIRSCMMIPRPLNIEGKKVLGVQFFSKAICLFCHVQIVHFSDFILSKIKDLKWKDRKFQWSSMVSLAAHMLKLS